LRRRVIRAATITELPKPSGISKNGNPTNSLMAQACREFAASKAVGDADPQQELDGDRQHRRIVGKR
jgi:hypothetical protein